MLSSLFLGNLWSYCCVPDNVSKSIVRRSLCEVRVFAIYGRNLLEPSIYISWFQNYWRGFWRIFQEDPTRTQSEGFYGGCVHKYVVVLRIYIVFLLTKLERPVLSAEDITHGLSIVDEADLREILYMLSYWRTVTEVLAQYLKKGSMKNLCAEHFGTNK